jgi:hypothetical protein
MAVQYARKYFEKYYWQYKSEIEELMGFVAFHNILNSCRDNMETDKDGAQHVMKRYGRFSGECEGLWEQVKIEFRRQFCYVLGQVSRFSSCVQTIHATSSTKTINIMCGILLRKNSVIFSNAATRQSAIN